MTMLLGFSQEMVTNSSKIVLLDDHRDPRHWRWLREREVRYLVERDWELMDWCASIEERAATEEGVATLVEGYGDRWRVVYGGRMYVAPEGWQPTRVARCVRMVDRFSIHDE